MASGAGGTALVAEKVFRVPHPSGCNGAGLEPSQATTYSNANPYPLVARYRAGFERDPPKSLGVHSNTLVIYVDV